MGRSRFGWATVLCVVAKVVAPGFARADPVPGFDLDPVQLTARMHECLAFTGLYRPVRAALVGDHGIDVVLRRFDAVAGLLDDPDQTRTGTDFETRCLDAVRELAPIVSGLSGRSLDEQDSVRDVLVSIPPWTILGECERESHFDLVCWNEANALAEHVQRPYLAARHIAAEDFHEPVDRFA
jgi:hypothetical protein